MSAWLRRWRWMGLVVGGVVSLAATAWVARRPAAEALRQHPYFVVDRLEITGAGPALSAGDVRSWLGLAERTTVWEAAPGRVRARLEAHPFIAHAAVKRVFPGTLEIVVRERLPLAIAVLGDLYYVDRAGVTFGPLRPGDPRNLPIITGLDPAAAPGVRSWMLRRALRLTRRCDAGGAAPPRCLGPLSEIHVDAGQGATVFPAAPRVPILLGWGSWSEKLGRAARALRPWRETPERLARLDVRFRNQVVATLRPAPTVPAPAATTTRKQRPARGRGLKA